MGPFRVVAWPQFFDNDLCIFQSVKDSAILAFIPEAGIETLAISVFPW